MWTHLVSGHPDQRTAGTNLVEVLLELGQVLDETLELFVLALPERLLEGSDRRLRFFDIAKLASYQLFAATRTM
jgi:hypothetical protein